MTTEMTIEIYGLRDALAELRSIDPKLRSQATRDIKAAGDSLIQEARTRYPAEQIMTHWGPGGRLGYDPGKARKGVQIQVGGRTPRQANAYSVVTIIQKNPGGALYDIAGLRGGSGGKRQDAGSAAFLSNLKKTHGEAQRGLWRARKPIYENARQVLLATLERIAADANRKLVA